MAYIAHVTIHAPEDVVIARAGMGGVDEDLHGGNRIIVGSKQLVIVIAGMRICIGIENAPHTELTVRLRQPDAIITHLPLLPQAICLSDYTQRFMQRPKRTAG